MSTNRDTVREDKRPKGALRDVAARRHRSRVYVILALATIAVGLIVHRRGAMLGAIGRDVLGDALWATMIVWWVSALAPTSRLAVRATIAYAICATVELSQLLHTPTLDALRNTTLGNLVLGSGFDPRDLAAYALGVLVAVLIEVVALRRRLE